MENSFDEKELEKESENENSALIKLPLKRVVFYPVCTGNPIMDAFSFTADYIEVGPENILLYAASKSNPHKYHVIAVISTSKIVGYYFGGDEL